MTLLDGINHLTFITADLDRLIAFYERVFDAHLILDLEEDGLRHAFIEVGPDTVTQSYIHSKFRASNPQVSYQCSSGGG